MFSFVAASIVWLRKSGYTKIYGDVNELGIPYLVSSVLVMLMVNLLRSAYFLKLTCFQIHDLYFYIIHRAMHTQLLCELFPPSPPMRVASHVF